MPSRRTPTRKAKPLQTLPRYICPAPVIRRDKDGCEEWVLLADYSRKGDTVYWWLWLTT